MVLLLSRRYDNVKCCDRKQNGGPGSLSLVVDNWFRTYTDIQWAMQSLRVIVRFYFPEQNHCCVLKTNSHLQVNNLHEPSMINEEKLVAFPQYYGRNPELIIKKINRQMSGQNMIGDFKKITYPTTCFLQCIRVSVQSRPYFQNILNTFCVFRKSSS